MEYSNNSEYCNISNRFFYRTTLVAASELKYNISNPNLNKNKKKLFLYFNNSHTNQTKDYFIHKGKSKED